MLTDVLRTTDKKGNSYPLLLLRATVFHIWLTLRFLALDVASSHAYAGNWQRKFSANLKNQPKLCDVILNL